MLQDVTLAHSVFELSVSYQVALAEHLHRILARFFVLLHLLYLTARDTHLKHFAKGALAYQLKDLERLESDPALRIVDKLFLAFLLPTQRSYALSLPT